MNLGENDRFWSTDGTPGLLAVLETIFCFVVSALVAAVILVGLLFLWFA